MPITTQELKSSKNFSKKSRIINYKKLQHVNIKRKSEENSGVSLIPTFFSKNQLLSLNLMNHVEKIYNKIQEKEKFLQTFITTFYNNPEINLTSFASPSFQPFWEKKLINPVNPYTIPQLRGLRIAAVDGGLGFRQYLSVQITLIKSTVVLYDFNTLDGSPTIKNFPPIYNNEIYSLYTDDLPISENSGSSLASLRRTLAENSMLLNFLKTRSNFPDLVILDGSLLPPPKPFSQKNTEEIMQNYVSCVKSFNELYNFCNNHDILLIGSVKDSRSTLFRDLLNRALPFYLSRYKSLNALRKIPYREHLKSFSDSELLFKIIPPKHRTAVFRMDSELPVLNLNKGECEFPRGIYGSYVQISPYDIPIRFEFLSPRESEQIKKKIDLIANILFPISNINPQCTLPLPQIEAHLRAHLPDEEMELITRQLESQFQIKHLISIKQNQGNIFCSKESFENSEKTLPFKSYFGTFLSKRHEKLDKMF